MRSFKSIENIHKKEGGSYYVVSANKASSVTLQSPGNKSQRKHCNFANFNCSQKKKNKKVENGKGTSSEGTPPPISDAMNILCQTRQMMVNSSVMMSPNGSQSYHMNNMNMIYPVNQYTVGRMICVK